MTNYLVIYHRLEESLKIIPCKIAETVNGKERDLDLPPNKKENYSDIESFILVISANSSPNQIVDFLSPLKIGGKDFDLLIINQGLETDRIVKALKEVIEKGSGKLYSQENLSTQNKSQEELLKEAEEFGFRIFKL